MGAVALCHSAAVVSVLCFPDTSTWSVAPQDKSSCSNCSDHCRRCCRRYCHPRCSRRCCCRHHRRHRQPAPPRPPSLGCLSYEGAALLVVCLRRGALACDCDLSCCGSSWSHPLWKVRPAPRGGLTTSAAVASDAISASAALAAVAAAAVVGAPLIAVATAVDSSPPPVADLAPQPLISPAVARGLWRPPLLPPLPLSPPFRP